MKKLLALLLSIGVFISCPMAQQSADSLTNQGMPTYLLTDNYPLQNLTVHTEFLVDRTASLDLRTILQPSFQSSFKPLSELAEDTNQPEATYWLRIQINARVSLEDWQLVLKRKEQAYMLGSDVTYVTQNDRVDVYYLKGQSVVDTLRTGLYVPASEKNITKAPKVSRVPFSIKAGERITVYLRSEPIFNYDELHLYPVLVDADFSGTIIPSSDSLALNIQAAMSIQAVLGFLLLAFFAFTRRSEFLLLALVSISLFLHYPILEIKGEGINFYAPERPFLIQYFWVLFTAGTFFWLVFFIRQFTNLKERLPGWDLLARATLTVFVLHVLISFTYLSFWPGQEPFFELIALGFFMTLILLTRLVFIKSIETRVISFGALFLVFFSVLGILWNMGKIHLPFNPWVLGQIGMVFIFTIGLAIRLQKSEQAKAEAERIQEIDAIKSRFFANISHEFRTPLTLILNPLKKIEEEIPASDYEDNGSTQTQVTFPLKYVRLMRRNADRLLRLINQLLDLNRLENGKLQLQLQPGNLTAFLRAMVFSFESLAERRQIHFQTQFPNAPMTGYFDRDNLEKILTNLLSNAFKYTPEQGTISVEVSGDEQRLRIQVKDSGPGIEQEALEKIFDRFYQVEGTEDQGSGIGLSLVKELVNLHHGQISVDSVPGKGTTFKVSVPINRSFFAAQDFVATDRIAEEIVPQELPGDIGEEPDVASLPTEQRSDDQQARVLIVEDNPDLRSYVADHLGAAYQILTAVNGQEGLQVATEHQPDLIISDVMMPKLSGTEMCTQLKTNEITSHIPIILLTAKAGQEHKLAGLETGADAYLTKPFDGKELSLRVAKLIEQRQRLRAQFSKTMKLSPREVAVTSVDEQFLQTVMTRIEDNIDNEFFSVEDLAEAVGMSRSHLHRKLKALCDQSPNQLIRNFRLQRAKELLEKKAGNVSEVAFQVGYSSLSYFTKSFKAQFGQLPSEI